jgi:hypothetical protein
LKANPLTANDSQLGSIYRFEAHWNIVMTPEFEQFALDGPVTEAGDFQPIAHHDPDGDCIEFIASDESYYAQRLDSLVTVYIGRETGEIVGSFIIRAKNPQVDKNL